MVRGQFDLEHLHDYNHYYNLYDYFVAFLQGTQKVPCWDERVKVSSNPYLLFSANI